MAKQSRKQNKTTQAAKNAAKSSKTQQMQNRREIAGIICILLCIFSIICCFDTDAFLIKPATSLISGLFGQVGRYILPVILAVTVAILFTGKSKPIRLRIACAFSILLTVGAVYHLICSPEITWEFKMIAKLYRGGIDGTMGGLLGGFLAVLLKTGITAVGAYIVLIVLLLIQLITTMNMTVNSIITAIKNRPRVEKPEKHPEEPEQTPAERIVNHVAYKHIERVEKKRSASEYDIPVDDPPMVQTQKDKKNKSRVVSPDEFIAQQREKKESTDPQQVTMNEIELHEPLVLQQEKTAQETITPPAPPMPEEIEAPQETAPAITIFPPLTPPAEKLKNGEATACAQEIAQQIEQTQEHEKPEYVYPPVSLLTMRKQGTVDATAEMRENSQRLADALQSFGIEPHIVNVIRGPSVTRYELELNRGVKLSKITNLANDIALSLGAASVRISAIPDKISVVGIEVPNKVVNTVFCREVIDSPTFRNSKSRLSFAVGKDISGNCIVGDISKLPHMLIAGTTGSGKSVCMNTLIISLLYKSKPEEVRLIMVDPKMVELGIYNGIPHLLIPVVTDPKKAAGALQWTVAEMMRRYRLMSEAGVRDLESYNKTVINDPDQKPLEQIVVVIDELADLMLVAAKEVEESICRIAQMGRASGIHLVIATQRPSADVITGLMKANIPSRIAFAVSSAMESRIILDTQGAEKLVGKGDMLFAPLGQGKPKRVQGCFISDEEVQAVVSTIKAQSESDYSTEIMEQIDRRAEQGSKNTQETASGAPNASDGDELLPAAVEVVLETGQASVSMLQRRLKLGYARAARIVDEMEERGIVGPFEGAKPRAVLITKEQWQQIQNGTFVPENPQVEEEIL